MPRKAPPSSLPLSISSPINLDEGYGQPASSRTASGGRGGPRVQGYNDYDLLTPSPTAAYLDQFTSPSAYPSRYGTPLPIPGSPSMDSPNFHEKDPLDESRPGSSAAFGYAQSYPSDRFLTPGPSDTSPLRSTTVTKTYRSRTCIPQSKAGRRWLFWGVPIGLVIAAGIAVGVVLGVTKHPKSSSGSSGSSSDSSSSSSGQSGVTSGTTAGDNSSTVETTAASGQSGSTVTTDLGVQFTYQNDFGGSWAIDPENPYSVSGQAQSWTPRLNETWTYGTDIVRGVNLGGWLVTEPFIAPGLYEQYQNSTPQAVDEYTLSQAMGSNLATAMEEHYKTFITEEDFADITAAGLNWVRIPVGFWAIGTESDDPYLAQVSWTYFVKAIGWARKYGLRVLLDFHALPGSQNGWNHSGRAGSVNWMYGVMGIANAQRSLEYIRSMVEYISQDGIKEVVPMMSLVNEVQATVVGLEVMQAFYYQAYEVIRGITGFGAGNGPIIALHEGFLGIAAWSGFLNGADRIALDQHPYLAFGDANTNPWSWQQNTACSWGGGTNDSQSSFGLIMGGEWSLAINDCGKWLDGVGSVSNYGKLASCDQWDLWMDYSDDTKADLMGYAQANMDALQNWFFWTWKIGNSTELGYSTSPFWHYKLGWQNGWIPKDPRVAGGYCKSIGVSGDQFNGVFPASATGAVASPTIDASQVSNHSVWPPTSMAPSFTASQIALFPTRTQTGTPIVLPTPAHVDTASIGSGWANSADTTGAWVPVAGCSYPNEYAGTDVAVPTAVCTGSARRRRDVEGVVERAGPTPAPVS